MNTQLVDQISATQVKKDIPAFGAGDTVRVSVRIIENGKARIQNFEGVVIARRGSGVSETFIVRKYSGDVGVERTFPINSPTVAAIAVLKKGKVRRSRIYYIRQRRGKSARLKEVLTSKGE